MTFRLPWIAGLHSWKEERDDATLRLTEAPLHHTRARSMSAKPAVAGMFLRACSRSSSAAWHRAVPMLYVQGTQAHGEAHSAGRLI